MYRDGFTLVGREDLEGLEADHWTAAGGAADRVADAYGLAAVDAAEVWLTVDGGWVARATASGATRADDGTPVPFTVRLDIEGVDDPANRVAVPAGDG
jgi:hypothetical protein